MLRFHADDFCRSMGIFPQVWARLNSGMSPDDQSTAAYGQAVLELERHCKRLQLPVSLKQVTTILERVRGISEGHPVPYAELGRMTTDLYSRVIDELGTRYFLALKAENVVAYDEPLREWQVQISAFPSLQDEIVEAQKCYALDRSTACVFHLMRALETPLRVLSTELGIVKHSPTWEAYLSAMEKAIAAKFPDKSKAHADKRAYFAGLESQLRAIKTAWRNPTMHDLARLYTSEMANELIVLIRGFVREAAKELQEPP